jgi:hypothetical protein
MTKSFGVLVAVLAGCLAGAGGAARAAADAPPKEPTPIAVLDLDYIDTSGEPTDQVAAHERRMADFVEALRRDLASGGRYRIVRLACGAKPCASDTNPAEVQKAARDAGARLVVIGAVHKMSTLVEWAKIDVANEAEDRIVFDRLLTFRGDTDEAWKKAETFGAREILEASP